MRIGKVDLDKEQFLIAEAGINHNGSLDLAMKMIGVAKDADCNAIKFQTYKTDEFCPRGSEYYETFKRCELPDETWVKLGDECARQGIIFMSTPQNLSDLERIHDLLPAIKVGSDDLTNYKLIREYAEYEKPIILSTGMSDIGEIGGAVEACGDCPVAILVCTSLYPCPTDKANLGRLRTLQRHFPYCTIGFSDHTIGVEAAGIASALGAQVLETHFTLDNSLPTPDHGFSKDPAMLKWWVESIRCGREMMGTGRFELSQEEAENKARYQRESGQELRTA